MIEGEAMPQPPAYGGERRAKECGDLPFLVRRDGTWLYRGSPIDRKEMVCLFSSVLRRDEAGDYWLETPAERGRIAVEDTPWLAVELEWRGCGRTQVLWLRTHVAQVVGAGGAPTTRCASTPTGCVAPPFPTCTSATVPATSRWKHGSRGPFITSSRPSPNPASIAAANASASGATGGSSP